MMRQFHKDFFFFFFFFFQRYVVRQCKAAYIAFETGGRNVLKKNLS